MDEKGYKAEVVQAFDGAAPTYDGQGVDFFTPMGRRLVEIVAPRAGEHVLDVGCGRGAALFPAAERIGSSGFAVGIDISPQMVKNAALDAARRGITNVRVDVMDAECPKFDGDIFDVVMGSYSIIFLPRAATALRAYHDLLNVDGRLGFTTPVFSDDTFPFLPPVFTELIPTSVLSRLPLERQPDAIRRRFAGWLSDTSDMERTLADAGFVDVHIRDEVVTMVAKDGASWVNWSHTQGMRLLWNSLSPSDHDELAAHLTCELDLLRADADELRIDVPVRYVLARAGTRSWAMA